ncbi:MAG TPA: hypothetical protein VKD72_39810, partial [Gemmataceae bacterium]|nr:hypothetical protein [Gemmataceae bacterium]
MSIRGQIYLLQAMSMFCLLCGCIGSVVVVTFFVDYPYLSAFTIPFILVGLFGVSLTSVISRLS